MSTIIVDECLPDQRIARIHREIPYDDYVIHAVVRRGAVRSTPYQDPYVEIHDLCEDTTLGTHFVVRMKLMDASYLSDLYQERFEGPGLGGVFNLKAQTGLLTFVKAHEGQTQEELTDFLLDSSSHELVRHRYDSVFSLGTTKSEGVQQ